jgi:hypothetical protein
VAFFKAKEWEKEMAEIEKRRAELEGDLAISHSEQQHL